MYESPINVYFKQAQEAARKVDEEVGNQIMIAVWDVGVTVDHDELLKALQYDRGQYEKGYADGKVAAEIRAIKKFKDMLKAQKHECGCNHRKKAIYAVTEEKIDLIYEELVGEEK